MTTLLDKARARRRQAIAGRAARASLNRGRHQTGLRLNAPRETETVPFVSARALPAPGAFLQ